MNNCDWLTDADTRACAHTSPRIFVFCSKLWPGIVNCQARKQQNFIYAFKKFFMASHSFNFPVILCEVIVRKSEYSTASQEIPVKIQFPTIRYKQLNDSLQNIFDSSFLEWSTNNFKQLPEYLESKMTSWMKKVPILSRIFGNVSFRMIDGKQGKYSLGKNIKQHLISKNHWNSKDIRVWTFETKLEESASCQPKWACVLWILYVYKVVFFNFTINISTQYSENSEYCVDLLNDVAMSKSKNSITKQHY